MNIMSETEAVVEVKEACLPSDDSVEVDHHHQVAVVAATAESNVFAIRVKTNVGIWTVSDVTPQTTIQYIAHYLRDLHKASFVREFTKDVEGHQKLAYKTTMDEAGLKDNDLIFTQVKLW